RSAREETNSNDADFLDFEFYYQSARKRKAECHHPHFLSRTNLLFSKAPKSASISFPTDFKLSTAQSLLLVAHTDQIARLLKIQASQLLLSKSCHSCELFLQSAPLCRNRCADSTPSPASTNDPNDF